MSFMHSSSRTWSGGAVAVGVVVVSGPSCMDKARACERCFTRCVTVDVAAVKDLFIAATNGRYGYLGSRMPLPKEEKDMITAIY